VSSTGAKVLFAALAVCSGLTRNALLYVLSLLLLVSPPPDLGYPQSSNSTENVPIHFLHFGDNVSSALRQL